MEIYSEFFDDSAIYKAEFQNKGYPHFDSKYSKNQVLKILQNLSSTGRLSHTFYPLIRYEMPKYKRRENGAIYIDRKNPRHIMHTARVDANIYSFYRNILMNKYDTLLKKLKIDDCVIAYRKIPVNEGALKNKCNVHFANDSMDEIIRRIEEDGECSAIAMDITKFFDSLDHKIIKRQWARVIESETGLPKDHFTIYKNITRFRYIDGKKLERILKGDPINLKICSDLDFRKIVLKETSSENKIGILNM